MIARGAEALDERILAAIAGWRAGASLDDAAFDALARDVFAYQVATNAPYRRYAESLGFGDRRMPQTWREIPAVPAAAFKDATLATFPIDRAALEFHTSGTTASRPGRHYMETAALYDAALLAGFEHFMLGDGARPAFINLVPDPRERPHSSLGYMMRHVAATFGDGPARFYLHGDRLEFERIREDLGAAVAAGNIICIATTAFALVALLDELDAGGERFVLPAGSRIMETGGFKGRSRVVARDELYARATETLGIPLRSIVAEYGMTELTSQYYDAPASRDGMTRVKAGPPWLRTLLVDAEGREVASGATGFVQHLDLANRSSVPAIRTEDQAYAVAGGFVLLGRAQGAPLRGCSLDAEDLRARAAVSR